MNASTHSKRLVPGFVLFLVCTVVCLFVMLLFAPRGAEFLAPWLARFGLSDLVNSAPGRLLLLANVILGGSVVSLSTLHQEPFWSDWAWINKLGRSVAWLKSPWGLAVARLPLAVGTLIAIQAVVRSQNYRGSVIVFLAITGVCALRVYRDIRAQWWFRLAAGNNPQANKKTGPLARLLSPETTERISTAAWAIWLSSGVVYVVGLLPPLDFSRLLDVTPIGTAVGVKKIVFWSACAVFLTSVFLEALRRARGKQRVHFRAWKLESEYSGNAAVDFGMRFSVSSGNAVARAIVEPARHISKWIGEFGKVAWEKLASKDWMLPMCLQTIQVAALWVVVYAVFAVTPHLAAYLHDGTSWTTVVSLLPRIVGWASLITGALAVATVRITENEEVERFWGRLGAVLWAFPAAGVLGFGAQFISSRFKVDVLPAFSLPGLVVAFACVYLVVLTIHDAEKKKLRITGPTSVRTLASKLGISGLTLLDELQKRSYSSRFMKPDSILLLSTIREVAEGRGLVVVAKMRKKKLWLSIQEPTVAELAKYLEVPEQVVIDQVRARIDKELTSESLLVNEWIGILSEENSVEIPAHEHLKAA